MVPLEVLTQTTIIAQMLYTDFMSYSLVVYYLYCLTIQCPHMYPVYTVESESPIEVLLLSWPQSEE